MLYCNGSQLCGGTCHVTKVAPHWKKRLYVEKLRAIILAYGARISFRGLRGAFDPLGNFLTVNQFKYF